MVGCETALWLAEQGRQVTLVEELPALMMGGRDPVPHPNRLMLIDLLNQHKVKVITDFYIAEVAADGVELVSHNFERQHVLADTVGLSVGLHPERRLYNELVGKMPDVYLIGDAREPRNVMGAIWDAYEVARNL